MKLVIKIYRKIIDILLTLLGIIAYHLFHSTFIKKTKSNIKKHQFKKIRKLLIYVSKHVPYYRSLFNDIGFIPKKDFKSLSDLEKIPILEKETVRNNRDSFISEKKNFYVKFKTSGSSGAPFEAMVSYGHWIVEQAVIWRQWKSFNYKFRDKIGILRSFAPIKGEPIIKNDKIRNFIYYSPYHLSEQNMKEYHRDMESRKIKFLRGYPSSIKIFADFCKRNKLSLKNLKGILLASEQLTIEDKSFIGSVFEAPIINHYGLAECIIMFGNLYEDNMLYNYEDYGYLEVIKNSSNKYEAIGTNLNNYAMPLIRFNTGDLVSLKKNNFKSKQTIPFRSIKEVHGRSSDKILTKNKEIPVTNLYTKFSKCSDIKKFQIIQHKNLDLIFIVLCDSKNEQKIKAFLTEELFIFEEEKIDYTIEFSSHFKRTGEGKIPLFMRQNG